MKQLILFLGLTCAALAQVVGGGGSPSNDLSCSSATASGTAYACNLGVPVIALSASGTYRFKADVANTGAATINFSSLGSKAIKKATPSGATQDVVWGDIQAGQWVTMAYDGAVMQMESPVANTAPAIPYTAYAHQYMSGGIGTEGSPYTSADNTGGIQTAINTLSTRGGRVVLAGGRFTVTTTININTANIKLLGDGGQPIDPDGITETISGTKLKTSGGSNINMINVTASGRPGGVVINDVGIQGVSQIIVGSSPYTTDSAIALTAATDQTKIRAVKINNYAIGINLTPVNSTDTAYIEDSSFDGNGIGVYYHDGVACWFCQIRSNVIADDLQWGILAEPMADSNSNVDQNVIQNNVFARNCASGCTGQNPSNMFWGRHDSIISNNVSWQAGMCYVGNANCGGTGVAAIADGFVIIGNRNKITGNSFAGQTVSGSYGLRITGSGNMVSGNTFWQNDSDILLSNTSADNVVNQPAAKITDSGARNVVNGVGTNAGDPASTGNWNGHAKWAGLVIRDTTNNITYFYWSPTNRSTMTN